MTLAEEEETWRLMKIEAGSTQPRMWIFFLYWFFLDGTLKESSSLTTLISPHRFIEGLLRH